MWSLCPHFTCYCELGNCTIEPYHSCSIICWVNVGTRSPPRSPCRPLLYWGWGTSTAGSAHIEIHTHTPSAPLCIGLIRNIKQKPTYPAENIPKEYIPRCGLESHHLNSSQTNELDDSRLRLTWPPVTWHQSFNLLAWSDSVFSPNLKIKIKV